MKTFQDIQKYPAHEFTQLITDLNNVGMNDKNGFTFYAYFPYLITHHNVDVYFKEEETCKELAYDKIGIVRYLIDMGRIYNITNMTISYSDMKHRLLEILKMLPVTTEKDNTKKYVEKVRNVISLILEKLKVRQYEAKALESMIVNCAPIVPYSETIKQPGMETIRDTILQQDVATNYLDTLINELLYQNTFDILKESKLCESLILDGDINGPLLLNKDITLCNKPASLYYLLTYIRYCTCEDDVSDVKQKLFNLNTVYNNIIKGIDINVNEVMETLTEDVTP